MPPAIFAPRSHGARAPSLLAPSFSPVAARSVLLLTVLLAAAVSVGLAGVSAGIDPDLVRLLRAMAAIKTMMAVAAAAAIWWRLGSPIGGVRLVAYGVAVASMASGPALIWSMVHLAVGVALLHGGLFASLILLWRDPAVSQRLQSLITRRRRTAATMAERGDF